MHTMRAAAFLLVGLALGWFTHSLLEIYGDSSSAPTSRPFFSQAPRKAMPTPELPAATPRAHKNLDAEIPRRFGELLNSGRFEQAMRWHRRRCIDQRWREACRARALETARTLGERAPQRMEALLALWLIERPDDVVARYYRALGRKMRGDYRRALDELLDIRFQAQDELDPAAIESDIRGIVAGELERLRSAGDEEAGIDFLRFMILKDNLGQSRYRYILAEEFYNEERLGEALTELERIVYDSEWGGRARALSAKIKRQFEDQAIAERERATASDEPRIRVRLRRRGPHFMVDAMIDRRRRLSLLLDTGASLSSIYRRRAENLDLNLDAAPRVRLQTANGIVRAPLIRVERFSVADIELENFELAVLPDADDDSDGLLGMNYLGRFDFYIDQDEAYLYLGRRR